MIKDEYLGKMKTVSFSFDENIQINQMIEEIGEVLTSYNKMRRDNGYGMPIREKTDTNYRNEFGEEICDLIITAVEVLFSLGYSVEEIQNNIEWKIDRTVNSLPRTLL